LQTILRSENYNGMMLDNAVSKYLKHWSRDQDLAELEKGPDLV
jgi:hypothetical protein